ncbi:plasmid mobilization relaxosome protein MobC [Streptacidiphilus sp. P02-A3a]|uniref:plasmid mobilization protein n=1 Tax=Streptacidiphilus sp. P02-A3a TaxID=2704468 RepID=UPI0015FC5681|nr:plasmid mobilization relaxosome protein MobC [Streptacidiphilus sp. P02-A3a]QMU67100.1 plasmid mobilization relaxosome protein MobC [Streptacidiphilus sp. P02-A3a]
MIDRNDHQQPAADRTDPAATTLASSDVEVTCATSGASNSLRPSYGGSQAQAPAQGGGGAPARAPEQGGAAEGSRDQQEEPHPTDTPPAAAAAAAASSKPLIARASATAAARRKPKRRKRDAADPKKPISVRFSATERQHLEAQAKVTDLSLAHLIARRALADPSTAMAADARIEQLDSAIDELAATRSDLAAWGNNLNQIARRLNTDGTFLASPARDFLTAAAALLDQVRTEVERLDEAAFRIARRRGSA